MLHVPKIHLHRENYPYAMLPSTFGFEIEEEIARPISVTPNAAAEGSCAALVSAFLTRKSLNSASASLRGVRRLGSSAATACRSPRAWPFVIRKIAAGAKTEGGEQLSLVDKPKLDLAFQAGAGQPPVRQHRQRPNLAAMLEDYRLAHTLPRPELDRAVAATAGKPSVRQSRERGDRTAMRENYRRAGALFRPKLDLAIVTAAR